jgi:hypothetical protein
LEFGRTRSPDEAQISQAPLNAIQLALAETGLFRDVTRSHLVFKARALVRNPVYLPDAHRPSPGQVATI